jgi:hypothetical protein
MNKKYKKPTLLKDPNDDSLGQCYAPVENGVPVRKKKKHFDVDQSHPSNWIHVDCDPSCDFKR